MRFRYPSVGDKPILLVLVEDVATGVRSVFPSAGGTRPAEAPASVPVPASALPTWKATPGRRTFALNAAGLRAKIAA